MRGVLDHSHGEVDTRWSSVVGGNRTFAEVDNAIRQQTWRDLNSWLMICRIWTVREFILCVDRQVTTPRVPRLRLYYGPCVDRLLHDLAVDPPPPNDRRAGDITWCTRRSARRWRRSCGPPGPAGGPRSASRPPRKRPALIITMSATTGPGTGTSPWPWQVPPHLTALRVTTGEKGEATAT